MATLSGIYRYPVKGFNACPMPRANLSPGQGLPLDRQYAITNGLPSNYDGRWVPCRNFVINSIIDGLPKYRLELSERGDTIKILNAANESVSFTLDGVQSLDQASEALRTILAPLDLPKDLPAPRLIEHKPEIDHTGGLWDYTDTPISIINTDTVDAISTTIGVDLDPLRFRGNFLITDLEPWTEFDLIGKRVRCRAAELEIIRPINRCPATSVNPKTAERKPDVPLHLQEQYGHVYCGLYAKVVKGGEIKPGDDLTSIGKAELSLEEACNEAAPAYPLWPRFVEITRRTVSDQLVELTLSQSAAWPLPPAQEGQRIRFHLDNRGWTGAPVVSAGTDKWVVAVAESATSDPLTEYLRNKVDIGERVLVSGPYGRSR